MQRLIVPCLLLLALSVRLDAQAAAPVPLTGTRQHDITSTANGRKYRLYVAPPDGYVAEDTTRYPTLYLLDGHFAFPAAVAARAYMGIFRELTDVIIVGIGDEEYSLNGWLANRWRDYTPSPDPAADSSFAKRFRIPVATLQSGGGSDFLDVLRKDVIPFIDRAYRTTGDRGLSGHSLGGLFTAYALVTAPELFQRYGINSPSLWWHGGEMFAAESAFAKTRNALPAHVLLTVGAQEGASMVLPMERFARLLGSRGYQGMVLDTVVFQGETHTSVGPAMMSRTLRVLYGARK